MRLSQITTWLAYMKPSYLRQRKHSVCKEKLDKPLNMCIIIIIIIKSHDRQAVGGGWQKASTAETIQEIN